MSTFRVTMEHLTIHDHPNADALELAQVGLYRAVVVKGLYKTGDMALYIPEQAVLPDLLIEELGLTGRLAGKAKNRVKAVRLRGEISQGIVCRPNAAGLDWARVSDCPWLDDYAHVLDITKWVPEIPPHMAGEVESAPELIRWIDIENLQRYTDIFTTGQHVIATEKIHGTACLVTIVCTVCRAFTVPNNLFGRAGITQHVRREHPFLFAALKAAQPQRAEDGTTTSQEN